MEDRALSLWSESGPKALRTSPGDNSQWRSLAHLHGQSAPMGRAAEEQLSLLAPQLSRRDMMRIMAASLGLGAAQGCRREPPEFLVPPAHPEPFSLHTVPKFFATAVSRGGWGFGVLAESYSGRPTKLEGNPDHPASLGATDVFAQAEILTFYDPDRSQAVYDQNQISTWEHFERAIAPVLARAAEQQGEGLRLLTGNITSPTLLWQLARLLKNLPQARWHAYEPVDDENARRGSKIAFGEELDLVYRFDQADVVVALDSDFLFDCAGSVRYARDFIARRQVGRGPQPASMNRLYVVEPTPTITGAKADHRLPLAASKIAAFSRALAAAVGAGGATASPYDQEALVRAMAQDLKDHRGRSSVIAGRSQPLAVHALAHLINSHLGNLQRTVMLIPKVGPAGNISAATIADLAEDIAQQKVSCLVVLDANPVYTAPADLEFAKRFPTVPFTVHMGLFRDETAQLAQWHLPLHHSLESWSDVRAFDGTASIVQPLISPLYESRSAHNLIQLLSGAPQKADLSIVRSFWQSETGLSAADFEQWWHEALRVGVVPQSRAESTQIQVNKERILQAFDPLAQHQPLVTENALEILFRPDPCIWDGRYSNNAWLQEIPKPISKITWDNAAQISPALAARLELENGAVLEIEIAGRTVAVSVAVTPGQAEGCIVLPLGYGRWAAGSVGSGIGFNAYSLRGRHSMWIAAAETLSKTAASHVLATTQDHHDMHGRKPVRTGGIEQFRRNPETICKDGEALRHSLYPEYKYEGRQWGMVIDLTSCIGCNACTIACQAENNIPVVGREEVRVGREMHWIRVDTYFEGSADDPAIHHQPVPCMHCEKAPCELVCPVAATTHSHDGLNEMTYNRCIGTRYCSNNCPYKVRRFNYLAYQQDLPPVRKMHQNPEVTVRGRGVMEKCTYCVQRIRTAEIAAKRDRRPLADGNVLAACQQVCPTRAIVFGDLNDPQSEVRQLAAQPHNYALLAELNTRPRTTYLAEINNKRSDLA